MLILERPWTRQPQGAVGIAPAFAGSVGFLCNPGLSNTFDIATRKFSTATGTITNGPTQRGMAGKASSTNNTRLTWSTTPVATTAQGYAMLVVANPAAASTLRRAFILGDESASAYTQSALAFNSGKTSSSTSGVFACFEYSSGFKTSADSSAGVIDGGWHVFIANRTAANDMRLYVDGVDKTASSTSVAGISLTAAVKLHGSAGSTDQGYAQDIALACVFTRSLSLGEIAMLGANPWQIFAPRRITIPTAAAAAGVPTLSASTYVTGSLTSTGWRPQVTAS